MFDYLGLFVWSRPYINFDKYCQQVKMNLIIIGWPASPWGFFSFVFFVNGVGVSRVLELSVPRVLKVVVNLFRVNSFL